MSCFKNQATVYTTIDSRYILRRINYKKMKFFEEALQSPW